MPSYCLRHGQEITGVESDSYRMPCYFMDAASSGIAFGDTYYLCWVAQQAISAKDFAVPEKHFSSILLRSMDSTAVPARAIR